MFRIRVLILLVFISFSSYAQRVYWASEVLDFSSELSSYEYSAEQILGKPNALPQGGDNPNAWMPAKPNKLEFISVAFDKAIRIEQIVIAESYNPSMLYEIYLYNKNGNEFLVHTFEPRPIDLKSRLLRINIEKTKYKVESLRIIVDGRKVPGYAGIDAVGVSGSRKP
ncbi:MAG: OmpA family protein, partial [Cyclobacteriaceae bacterium]|nr:OmpA family protein [Cyclobacteriaceae bacterium]